MGPTSVSVFVVVGLLAVALLVCVARAPHWAWKAAAGAMSLIVGVFGGALVVNDFYGYYTSWGAAVADITGHGARYALHEAVQEPGGSKTPAGRLISVTLPGPLSGISRKALVYLPPEYDDPQFRTVRFPVIELLHGSPGNPSSWIVGLHINRYVDQLIANRRMGPVVLVMPAINRTPRSQDECLDTPATKDDIYLSQDVPSDIRARFRVATDPAEWGLMGYSSGGYCAANLALRHRTSFGATAILDGYFVPSEGPAARALKNPAALAANNPLQAATAALPGTPMPACWVAAGTGNGADYRAAQSFANAMSRLTQTTLFIEPGFHHSPAAWRVGARAALPWLWQALAPPDLRLQNPTVSSPTAHPQPTGLAIHPPAPTNSRPSSPDLTPSPAVRASGPARGTGRSAAAR